MTTEDDFEARINAEVEARMAARKLAEEAKLREEIAAEIRREQARKWYAEIDRRYSIRSAAEAKLEPERRRVMAERAAQTNREMDEANARVVSGTLRAQRMARKGGGAGFIIK